MLLDELPPEILVYMIKVSNLSNSTIYYLNLVCKSINYTLKREHLYRNSIETLIPGIDPRVRILNYEVKNTKLYFSTHYNILCVVDIKETKKRKDLGINELEKQNIKVKVYNLDSLTEISKFAIYRVYSRQCRLLIKAECIILLTERDSMIVGVTIHTIRDNKVNHYELFKNNRMMVMRMYDIEYTITLHNSKELFVMKAMNKWYTVTVCNDGGLKAYLNDIDILNKLDYGQNKLVSLCHTYAVSVNISGICTIYDIKTGNCIFTLDISTKKVIGNPVISNKVLFIVYSLKEPGKHYLTAYDIITQKCLYDIKICNGCFNLHKSDRILDNGLYYHEHNSNVEPRSFTIYDLSGSIIEKIELRNVIQSHLFTTPGVIVYWDSTKEIISCIPGHARESYGILSNFVGLDMAFYYKNQVYIHGDTVKSKLRNQIAILPPSIQH